MNRVIRLAMLGVGGYLAYRAIKPRYDFRGRHVVITGGSRGLGLVLARQLVDRGARVSICSRDSDELARASSDLEERGGRVVAVECDVTDRSRLREFIAVARAQNGPIDVLINNAGVIRVGPVEEMRDADYELSLRTHFWAALHAVNEVVPEMKARGAGRIVNIASIGGKVAVPHLLPYTVGKFALVGYSNGLRNELARHGIVVTTIDPGLMRHGKPPECRIQGPSRRGICLVRGRREFPGFSMNAECAAGRILSACARRCRAGTGSPVQTRRCRPGSVPQSFGRCAGPGESGGTARTRWDPHGSREGSGEPRPAPEHRHRTLRSGRDTK